MSIENQPRMLAVEQEGLSALMRAEIAGALEPITYACLAGINVAGLGEGLNLEETSSLESIVPVVLLGIASGVLGTVGYLRVDRLLEQKD